MLKYLIISCLVLPLVSCQTRATFGETCGDGIRCDSRASLSCIDNTCKCLKQDEMTFDKNKEKCVVISGERCSYTAVEVQEDKKWTEKLDCVENASCSDDGYCNCASTHYESLEGLCEPKHSFGTNCTKDVECLSGLVCDDGGVCSCDNSTKVYDPSRGECRSLVGSFCTSYYNHDCVANAECRNQKCTCRADYYQKSLTGFCYKAYGYDCDSNSPCAEMFSCRRGYCRCHYPTHQEYNSTFKECVCNSETRKGDDDQCLGKVGNVCSNQLPCIDELVCREGKCACPFPSYQFYNDSDDTCVSYVGGPCQEKVDGVTKYFNCIGDATCNNSTIFNECVCNEGYIESGENDKKCEIAYGFPCPSTKGCDTSGGLICVNSKCVCPDFQYYDEGTRKCRGLIGAFCNVYLIGFCTDGANCTRFRNFPKQDNQGRCKCSIDNNSNSDRKCIPSMFSATLATKSESIVLLELHENAGSSSQEMPA